MVGSERLRCATCGETTRARDAFVPQGWYSGPGGAKYCSSACASAAPKPKARDRAVFGREFRVTDYAAVLALWKASEGVVIRDADSRPALARYLRRNPGTSFVCEVDGCVVGAILAGHDGRRGFLHHLAVAPEHRRRGIGRALVERALSALEKQGIEKCHLMVLPSNVAARKFWRSLGWVERTDVLLMSRAAAGKPGA